MRPHGAPGAPPTTPGAPQPRPGAPRPPKGPQIIILIYLLEVVEFLIMQNLDLENISIS